MTYFLPSHYHYLSREVAQYRLGFKHGWSEAKYKEVLTTMATMRLQAQQDYEAQVEALRDRTPVMPVKRQQSWMRPMGTSQVCESGFLLEDASQGVN